jgi:trehalose 6-phosphate phosphatase
MMPPVGANNALFLDIDGTLLDLARTPDKVVVPDDLLHALEVLRVRLRGALAFVSGRSLASIDALFPDFRPAAIGSHGAEIRGVNGSVWSAAPLPAGAREIFTGLAETIPGLLLEDKTYAMALHYRLAPEAKDALMAAMEQHRKLFDAEKTDILHGKAVIEARHKGVDKGSAVARLAKEKPFVGSTPVFGGDDTTDIDVFKILPRLGGWGFSVGRAFPGAEHQFESPRAVREWLIGLAAEKVAS